MRDRRVPVGTDNDMRGRLGRVADDRLARAWPPSMGGPSESGRSASPWRSVAVQDPALCERKGEDRHRRRAERLYPD